MNVYFGQQVTQHYKTPKKEGAINYNNNMDMYGYL